jgi:hypothetical protein
MKPILLSAAILLLHVCMPDDTLTGRWETKPSVNGNVTGVVFKSDNSFEGYVNKKPFTTGNYQLQDSTFSFTDNGCMNMVGVYTIHFYSNGDSIWFEPVNDSCAERKKGMSRLKLGKVNRLPKQ